MFRVTSSSCDLIFPGGKYVLSHPLVTATGKLSVPLLPKGDSLEEEERLAATKAIDAKWLPSHRASAANILTLFFF